jgi:hypothetical protein
VIRPPKPKEEARKKTESTFVGAAHHAKRYRRGEEPGRAVVQEGANPSGNTAFAGTPRRIGNETPMAEAARKAKEEEAKNPFRGTPRTLGGPPVGPPPERPKSADPAQPQSPFRGKGRTLG